MVARGASASTLMSTTVIAPVCSGDDAGEKLIRHVPPGAPRIDNRSTHPSQGWLQARGRRGRGRLAPRDPGQGDCGKPSFDAGFDPASMRRRPQSCILSGLHNYEPMSRPLHWNVPAFDLLAPHVSPLRSLAKLPTVEGEAAAPPGMAS